MASISLVPTRCGAALPPPALPPRGRSRAAATKGCVALLGGAHTRLPGYRPPQTSIRAALPLPRKSSRTGGARKLSTSMGLPVISFVTQPWFLIMAWAFGAVRMWAGFSKTTYNNNTGTKVAMTSLWPVLCVISKTYRTQWKKAVTN